MYQMMHQCPRCGGDLECKSSMVVCNVCDFYIPYEIQGFGNVTPRQVDKLLGGCGIENGDQATLWLDLEREDDKYYQIQKR